MQIAFLEIPARLCALPKQLTWSNFDKFEFAGLGFNKPDYFNHSKTPLELLQSNLPTLFEQHPRRVVPPGFCRGFCGLVFHLASQRFFVPLHRNKQIRGIKAIIHDLIKK